MQATRGGSSGERWLLYAVIAMSAMLLVEIVSMRRLSEAKPVDGQNNIRASKAHDEAVIKPQPALADYQESIDRSLFAWNRLPRTAAGTSGDTTEPELSEWQLSGVISHPGRATLAIFVNPETSESMVLEEGMYLGIWEVSEIMGDTVTFIDGAKQESLQLETADVESTDDPSSDESDEDNSSNEDKANEAGSDPDGESSETNNPFRQLREQNSQE